MYLLEFSQGFLSKGYIHKTQQIARSQSKADHWGVGGFSYILAVGLRDLDSPCSKKQLGDDRLWTTWKSMIVWLVGYLHGFIPCSQAVLGLSVDQEPGAQGAGKSVDGWDIKQCDLGIS